MERIFRRSLVSGFSLIELMTVVGIMAVLLSVAAPSMQNIVYSNRLRTQVSGLITAINLTRAEAIRQNFPVSMCPSAMAETGAAECSGEYAQGWIIFTNRNKDRVVNSGDEVVRVFRGLPVGYTLTNKAGTRSAREIITFLPDGSSRRNRTLMLCPPSGRGVESVSVVMNIVGRARVARGWGECPPD